MSKIELTDSMQNIVIKMSEGNPGAINAICDIIKQGKEIDPQSFAGELTPILSLDTLGIYGTGIYILFSDQCRKDVRKMIMLLRANQLGFIGADKIKEIAADQRGTVRLSEEEMTELDKKVCKDLPSFQKPVVKDSDIPGK